MSIRSDATYVKGGDEDRYPLLNELPPEAPLLPEKLLGVLARADLHRGPISHHLPMCDVMCEGKAPTAGYTHKGARAGRANAYAQPCGRWRPCVWRPTLKRAIQVVRSFPRHVRSVHTAEVPAATKGGRSPEWEAVRKQIEREGGTCKTLLLDTERWYVFSTCPIRQIEHGIYSREVPFPELGGFALLVAAVTQSTSTAKDGRRKIGGSRGPVEKAIPDPLGAVHPWTGLQRRQRVLEHYRVDYETDDRGEVYPNARQLLFKGSDALRDFGIRMAKLPQTSVDFLIEHLGESPEHIRREWQWRVSLSPDDGFRAIAFDGNTARSVLRLYHTGDKSPRSCPQCDIENARPQADMLIMLDRSPEPSTSPALSVPGLIFSQATLPLFLGSNCENLRVHLFRCRRLDFRHSWHGSAPLLQRGHSDLWGRGRLLRRSRVSRSPICREEGRGKARS